MPQFEDHIAQAERNFRILEQVNKHIHNSQDWQVTIIFYTALHLVNAHTAKVGLQYRKHSDVMHAINPFNTTSLAKLDENIYVAYESLMSLSRRSRYLVNPDVLIQKQQKHKINMLQQQ